MLCHRASDRLPSSQRYLDVRIRCLARDRFAFDPSCVADLELKYTDGRIKRSTAQELLEVESKDYPVEDSKSSGKPAKTSDDWPGPVDTNRSGHIASVQGWHGLDLE